MILPSIARREQSSLHDHFLQLQLSRSTRLLRVILYQFFSESNLREITFSESNLREATFSESNLREITFSESNLREATFSESNLREITFSEFFNRGGGDIVDQLLSMRKLESVMCFCIEYLSRLLENSSIKHIYFG